MKAPSHDNRMPPATPQVPGIQGLEQGQPWPRDITPQLQRPRHGQKLESFQSILHKASEDQPSSLASPISTTSTVRVGQEQLEPTPKQHNEHIAAGFAPTCSPHSPTQVVVPDVAHTLCGGWFNPSNWLFKIVYPRVQHMGLDELFQAYFAREARPTYGDNHTSTRGKRPRDEKAFDDDGCLYISHKKFKSVEKHKIQERNRRDRHRLLQKESDDCTPTLIFDLAEKELPKVKDFVKNMPKEEIKNLHSSLGGNNKNTAAKKTGKDDQLLSAAMFSWLSGFVILRERQARVESEDKVRQLEHELREQHTARVEAEERAARLEVDSKHYAEEVSHLRQQLEQLRVGDRGSPASFFCAQPLLSSSMTSRERPATGMDWSPANNSDAEKRPFLAVEPMHRPPHGERRGHLPPSPSPSCDEISSSFCFL